MSETNGNYGITTGLDRLRALAATPETFDALPMPNPPPAPGNIIQNDSFNDVTDLRPINAFLEDERLKPERHQIFGNMLRESDVCFLGADTGQGKSIMAWEIADAFGDGKSVSNFGLPNDCAPGNVCIFDFENPDYRLRYDDVDYGMRKFSNNIHIWKRDYSTENGRAKSRKFRESAESIYTLLKRYIEVYDLSLIIIDNLTSILRDILDRQEVNELLENLHALKEMRILAGKNLTILVVCHYNKSYGQIRALSEDHITGVKNISNFADSIIGIGLAPGDASVEMLRYLKCLKARNGIRTLAGDGSDCAVFRLTKSPVEPNGGAYLRPEYLYLSKERTLLIDPVSHKRTAEDSMLQAVFDAAESDKPKTFKDLADIAKLTGKNAQQAARMMRKRLESKGFMRGFDVTAAGKAYLNRING
jgi:hypothetical protein